MKFQIDKQKLSDDQLLFLANFEIYFKQYVEKVLASYPDLGVIPCWNIMERKEQFFILESNADFGIKDSLYVNSKIESYINSNLKTANLEDLARELGYSAVYTGELIKKLKGKPFKKTVQEKLKFLKQDRILKNL